MLSGNISTKEECSEYDADVDDAVSHEQKENRFMKSMDSIFRAVRKPIAILYLYTSAEW